MLDSKEVVNILKSGFKPSAKRRPAVPPWLKRRQTLLLAGGIGLIVLVVLQVGWSLLRQEEEPQVQAIPAAQSATGQPPEAVSGAKVQAGLVGKVLQVDEMASKIQDCGLRPLGFVKKLEAKGARWNFKPIDSLRLPENGASLTVYLLMYARLDSATETIWQQAGMFKDEQTDVRRPFLRKVTLSSQECLDRLFDWHVEGFSEGTVSPP